MFIPPTYWLMLQRRAVGWGNGCGTRGGSAMNNEFPMSELPHPSRLDPQRPDFEQIVLAHQNAVANGARTYVDPTTGFVVLTRPAHLERGSCCSNGCRHCPWVTN